MKKNIIITFLIIIITGCDLFFLPPENKYEINQNEVKENEIIFVKNNFENLAGDYISYIYSMDINGNNVKTITGNDGISRYYNNLSKSHDGNKILYTFNNNIYTINFKGSGTTQLFTENDLTDICPSFSPDGNKVIFTKSNVHGSDICIIDSDGNNLKIIKHYSSYCSHPSISPNGDKILYTLNNNIYTMNLDGTGITQLTNKDNFIDTNPSYFCNGEKIAFIRSDPENAIICIMDINGDNLKTIKRFDDLNCSSLSVSSDNNNILYCYNNNIYKTNIEGTMTKQLTFTDNTQMTIIGGKFMEYCSDCYIF